MSKYAPVPHDFYPSAPWTVPELLRVINPPGDVWECAAGEHHMVKPLREHGYWVVATDIRHKRRVDFLKRESLPEGVRSIITNPPYSNGQADAFIKHALELTRPVKGTVCMLLKVKFDCAASRKPIFYECPAFRIKIVLTRRMLIPGFDHVAQPLDHHAWYCWDWNAPAYTPPVIHYA